MKTHVLLAGVVVAVAAGSALAKLPPLNDEAKAKAAEAAAKTGYGNKVADFQLCKSMDRVAAGYLADAKKAGKAVTPTPTAPCAEPGPFVYPPPQVAAAATPAKPAAPATPAKK